MKAKRVRTDVWLPEELKPFAGKVGYVQSQPFADTFSLTFPNEPLCKVGDYTWVPDFFVYQVEDVEAQQQAVDTPHVPAQVDAFLSGGVQSAPRGIAPSPEATTSYLYQQAQIDKLNARIRELEALESDWQRWQQRFYAEYARVSADYEARTNEPCPQSFPEWMDSQTDFALKRSSAQIGYDIWQQRSSDMAELIGYMSAALEEGSRSVKHEVARNAINRALARYQAWVDKLKRK
jgi:hypothetical protein